MGTEELNIQSSLFFFFHMCIKYDIFSCQLFWSLFVAAEVWWGKDKNNGWLTEVWWELPRQLFSFHVESCCFETCCCPTSS